MGDSLSYLDKYSKRTYNLLGRYFDFCFSSLYFESVFNSTIIPLWLVGYINNSFI